MINRNISEILRSSKSVAVVGISDKPGRPSNRVAKLLKREGYTVFPVNPLITQWDGQATYPDLESVPASVDIVDIFRRPEHVPDIVDAAIRIGAKTVWMQLGVVHEPAAMKALESGLHVVMDRCIAIELWG